MKVLVTDAHNRVALTVARALADDGFDVTAVEQERWARPTPLAFASRAVKFRAVTPDLNGSGEPFRRSLLRIAEGHDVLLPISINTLLHVATHREAFAARGVAIPLPPLDLIRRANDKAAVAETARACGVSVPRTERLGSLEDLDRASRSLRFPAVVKIAVDEGLFLAPGERYRRVRDPEEMEVAFTSLRRHRAPLVMQEFVEGEGYGCSALCGVGGAVLASVEHRRIREYPVSGGPSSCCESVSEPALSGAARRLLAALGWSGVAMVEFRRDEAGTFWMMEMNPRFWGSLPLAMACGLNIPALLCRQAVGQSPPIAGPVRPGVRVQWRVTDFLAAASAGVGEALSERGFRGYVRDLLDHRVSDAIFDSADPRPGLLYMLERAGAWMT